MRLIDAFFQKRRVILRKRIILFIGLIDCLIPLLFIFGSVFIFKGKKINGIISKHKITLSIITELQESASLYDYKNKIKGKIEVLSDYVFLKNDQVNKDNFKAQKVVFSNFPDNGYLPLAVALYNNVIPDYIIYANKTEIDEMPDPNWISNNVLMMKDKNIDLLFGGNTTYQNKTVGIGLMIAKTSIIQGLVYNTNSKTNSPPPLLMLSMYSEKNPGKLKVEYSDYNHMKDSINYNYVDNFKLVKPQKCLNLKNDTKNPTISYLLPQFKRSYIYHFITDFEKQTVKPEFYCLFQCENRLTFDLKRLEKLSSRPIYHIWCYNWKPYFFLPDYVAGLFPTDFVIRYDDDQYSKNVNILKKLIKMTLNKDMIIGYRGNNFSPRCKGADIDYYFFRQIYYNHYDHVAVPLLFRPIHIKLMGRFEPITILHGEDIVLSISNSFLCNTTIYRYEKMKPKEYQSDGLKHGKDKQSKSVKKISTKKFCKKQYCQFILNGYKPVTAKEVKLHRQINSLRPSFEFL